MCIHEFIQKNCAQEELLKLLNKFNYCLAEKVKV